MKIRVEIFSSCQLPKIVISITNSQPVAKTKAINKVNFRKSSPSLLIERNKKNVRTKYTQTKKVKNSRNIII